MEWFHLDKPGNRRKRNENKVPPPQMEFTMNCETTRDLLATIENACEAQRALLMKADGLSQNDADALTTLARSLHEIKQKILFEAIKARWTPSKKIQMIIV